MFLTVAYRIYYSLHSNLGILPAIKYPLFNHGLWKWKNDEKKELWRATVIFFCSIEPIYWWSIIILMYIQKLYFTVVHQINCYFLKVISEFYYLIEDYYWDKILIRISKTGIIIWNNWGIQTKKGNPTDLLWIFFFFQIGNQPNIQNQTTIFKTCNFASSCAIW